MPPRRRRVRGLEPAVDPEARTYPMILYPLIAQEPPKSSGHVVSAWAAVERAQKLFAPAYWLIAQTDHAALSGALAGNFSSQEFPAFEEEIVQAISLHDAGWAQFDAKGEGPEFHPACNPAGKPLSFFEISPTDFTRAWRTSIDRAEESGPLGATLVSKHFCRLGQGFMHERAHDPGANLVREFLTTEMQRQTRLAKSIDRARGEVERLVDVLQFCDLLSLYLCSGSCENVEFPQRLATAPVRLRRGGGGFNLEPNVIKNGASLGVTARRYPPSQTEPNSTELGFLLV